MLYLYNVISINHFKFKVMNEKKYYEVHITGRDGFSVCVISDKQLDDDEIILLGYEQDLLHDDDCHYVDYIDELTFDEWNQWFNFNNL